MTARRQSFRVIEGGRDLHRVPVVPVEPLPCVSCWIAAAVVVNCVLGIAVWAVATARWGRV